MLHEQNQKLYSIESKEYKTGGRFHNFLIIPIVKELLSLISIGNMLDCGIV